MKGRCIEIVGDLASFHFEGEKPESGEVYNLEDAVDGSLAQNRMFHKLVTIYWKSGLHPTLGGEPFEKLRDWIKDRLGEGKEKYIYAFVDDSGRILSGECKKYKEIPEHVINGLKDRTAYAFGKLKSWSRYTCKQRRKCIDNLINEMLASGVNDSEFQDIIKERKND